MPIGDYDVTTLLRHVTNTVAMGVEYSPNWNDEFSLSEARKSLEDIQTMLKSIDFTKLSVEQLKELGFSRWSEESNVYLVPLYLYRALPDGIVLTSIDGETAVKGKDNIDLDVRYGRIAYGIEVNED